MKIKANKLIAVLCAVVMLVSTMVPALTLTAFAADVTATISFASTAQRTSQTSSQQVWTKDGITFINDKASASSAVANYSNPVRLYQGSKITVTAPGNITKIVFDCNSSKYATALKDSIGTTATVSVSSDKVTVTPSTISDTFVIAKLTAQVRMDSLTVTYSEAAGACEHANTTDNTTPATCVNAGNTTTTCDDCGEVVAITPIPAFGHTVVEGVCETCGWVDTNYRVPSDDEVIFNFGDNKTVSDTVDGSGISAGKTYTEGDYTFKLDSATKVYGGAYDLKGNSAIKLGTSSEAGSFSFTVPEDIAEVIIYAAQYKTNAATVTVNGVATKLDKQSNNGEYNLITVDTSTTKTVNFEVTTGTRCMINMIVFVKAPAHVHEYSEEVTDPTCTTPGYTTYTCDCGDTYTGNEVAALGHTYNEEVTDPTCTEAGYTTYTCACGDTYTGNEVAALGHTFVNSICACGVGSIEASFLQVQVREDGMADVRLVLTLTADELATLSEVGVYASLDKNDKGAGYATTTVYETVNAGGKVVEAKEGTYFVLVEIINISDFDAKIYVTPFVATETTEALGAMVAFSVNQYID